MNKLGSLSVHRLGPEKGEGLVVVFCHGFGAPGDDLVGIGRALNAPQGTQYVFPEAPISLAEAANMPAYGDARAWWLIDMERMQRAAARGEIRDLTREVPAGLTEARTALLSLVDALEAEGTPSSRIVLGGFSQGSMLATDVLLRTTRAFAGLVVMSGTLLCEDEWRPLMAARKGMRVYQSHGKDDPILPFSIAERLRDDLKEAGLDVTFRSFNGGHAIPPPVMMDVGDFLRKL